MEEQFLNIIKDSGIKIDDNFLNTELISIKVNDQKASWRFCLKFNNIVKVETLKELVAKVSTYLVEKYKIKKVKFTISYDEKTLDNFLMAEEDLRQYFDYAIFVCAESKKGVLTLKEFYKKYLDNEICLMVSTEEEQNSVNDNLNIIKRFFQNYGLNFIKFNVVISDSVRNFKELHNGSQQVKEQLDSIQSAEKYRKLEQEYREKQPQAIFSYASKGKMVSKKISELPINSLEVEEFKQIEGTNKIQLTGMIVTSEVRALRSRQGRDFNLFVATITDYKDSILIKRFIKDNEVEKYKKTFVKNLSIFVKGNLQWDDFAKDVVVMCDEITVLGADVSRVRYDEALEKRVELHAHTKMSVLDSILSVEDYVWQAKNYGHKAIAVTDHANCHILPEFFNLCKKVGIKPIAGVEGYYINDDSLNIAFTDEDIDLKDATYVVFDIETTGLYIPFNEIIEIGAVKIKNSLVIDQFAKLVRPKHRLFKEITEITHITDEMLEDQLPIEEVLPEFKKFIEGCVLVAHNAHFDTDFIYAELEKLGMFEKELPCIDTMMFARGLYGGSFKQNNLRAVGKFLKVEVEPNDQHRAVYDAKTTGNIFMKLLGEALERKYDNYNSLNKLVTENELFRYKIPSHINILVKNRKGLKNFYKIISESHTTYFQKDARILKSLIEQYREDLLIGSGCCNGEIFRLALEKTPRQLEEALDFYDYIEVQPPKCYLHLFEMWPEDEAIKMIQQLIKEIIDLASKKNKIVVATGDVHELIEDDAEYRKIYLSIARPNGGGPHELAKYEGTLDMHYRNTSEMLKEFSFLDGDLAYKIVVTNTNLINNMIDEYELFPKKLYVPRDDFMADKNGVSSMKKAVQDISYETAYNIYGHQEKDGTKKLNLYVEKRLKKELDAIIGHGYFSVYYISHLLVKNSNDAGYIVGSRGSVGSSFVATMMGITEVNPLKPHYVCPKCHYTAFKLNEEEKREFNQQIPYELDEELQKVNVGADLKPMRCPECGALLNRNGFDIEFETFLGFSGDKVPDIDLNFSGEYQAKAHLFCQETFGVDNAFRAGTVSTVQPKTAFAYARDYYQQRNIFKRQTELDRLSIVLSESKRTTGQHPGGIVIVPDDIEYTDIIPVQYPPVGEGEMDDLNWRTSHYDYHKFENNLLKLDILGHDDPTMVKFLMDFVHQNQAEFPFSTVDDIPYFDEKVLSLFSSKDALNLGDDDLDSLSSGTIGIPEFGTQFVRSMLEVIKPNSISQIIKVSGLAHGTNVWMKNAEDLVKGTNLSAPIAFNDVIGCRDDIMKSLIEYGVPAEASFKIMESVRKGKKLTIDQEEILLQHNVPDWFINSCKKIEYLFPKAHATAYVIMALRIAWFKIHRPIYYYAAYFSKRAKEFDAEAFASGENAIRNRLLEIEKKMKSHDDDNKPSNKEIDLYDELKLALEMNLRGLSFKQIDVNISDATSLVISKDKKSLYLPFVAVESLGETVALSIVEARKQGLFTSKKDFELRTNINKKQFANLIKLEAFGDLPDDDTIL